MNKRVERAYPVEIIDAKLRWRPYEAIEATPGTVWHRMMGIQTISFCVIRNRDPDTGEILNRPTLAAGPLASMEEAQELVKLYSDFGEPNSETSV